MERNRILRLVWNLLDRKYSKIRLLKLLGRVTIAAKRLSDGVMLAVGRKGDAPLIHLSVHVGSEGVLVHFESGTDVELDLFRWSFTEFVAFLRNLVHMWVDYLFDLAFQWDLTVRRVLVVVPLEDVSLEVWEVEPGGRGPYVVEVDFEDLRELLVKVFSWFVPLTDRLPESAVKVDGLQVEARIREWGVSCLIIDPASPQDFLVVDGEGYIESAGGPIASQVFLRSLSKWFPGWEALWRHTIARLQSTGVLDRIGSLLIESLTLFLIEPGKKV